MKLVTKHSDYAVRAITYIAENKRRFVSSLEIANKQKIPLLFLRRILQSLIKEKIIVSKEGVKGGVRLVGDPKRITVADVIKIFQGNIQLSDCMFRKEFCCNRKTCLLRKKIKNIEDIVGFEFKKITIQSLLIDAKRRKK